MAGLEDKACLDMKRTYCVYNKTAESFLGLNVTLAATICSRLRGFVGKLRIGSDEGVWIVPSHGIHTFGVLFPIDVIYLDSEYRVIHLLEHVGPFRLTALRWKSSSVLELPPHTIYASQTKVGDELVICRPDEMDLYLKGTNAGDCDSRSRKAAE